MPSDTGLPGGKRTGHSVSHFIVAGGPFDLACNALLHSGFRLNWHDRVHLQSAFFGGPDDDAPDAPAKKDRVKFTCDGCGLNAWAKPSARLTCTLCQREMTTAATSSALTTSIPQEQKEQSHGPT